MNGAPTTPGSGRWAWAEVDLGAIADNVRTVRAAAAPSAVWAVVKANGYGHGAVPVAQAALDAGAAGLCVALAQEGAELRAGGVDGRILVLSEQPPGGARRGGAQLAGAHRLQRRAAGRARRRRRAATIRCTSRWTPG